MMVTYTDKPVMTTYELVELMHGAVRKSPTNAVTAAHLQCCG
ncbi:hypothetical protein VCR1J2_590279 [Vibrio coralliirubri]|nr:hypothetical protein VCR1J2_590279 [Vibrio coralliirubri]CDU02906.1 hypothetical protein VCR8J2_850257 [Vibrio coralliirubri]